MATFQSVHCLCFEGQNWYYKLRRLKLYRGTHWTATRLVFWQHTSSTQVFFCISKSDAPRINTSVVNTWGNWLWRQRRRKLRNWQVEKRVKRTSFMWRVRANENKRRYRGRKLIWILWSALKSGTKPPLLENIEIVRRAHQILGSDLPKQPSLW